MPDSIGRFAVNNSAGAILKLGPDLGLIEWILLHALCMLHEQCQFPAIGEMEMYTRRLAAIVSDWQRLG